MTATLYLHNVPDEVIRRLEILAARSGASVSATAVAELAGVTRRADNADILNRLADLPIGPEQIVSEVETGRPSR